MPYQKRKSERYKNLAGINSKISQYLNGPMEFLNLSNLDFQTPGTLTKRWGSTQYFGASLSGKVNGLFEFTQINGSSYFYAAAGGTLGLALNGGFSAIFSGSTAGMSYLSVSIAGQDGWSLGSFDMDFSVLQNNVFLANGKDFLKSTGGSSFVFFGLPRFICGSTLEGSGANFVANGTSIANGFTGYYYYKLAWKNSYNMYGAPTVATNTQNIASLRVATTGASSITVSMSGASVGRYLLPPPNFDINGVGIFRAGPTATDFSAGFTNYFNKYYNGQTLLVIKTIEDLDYFLVGSIGVSAGSVSATFIDTSLFSQSTPLNKNIIPYDWYQIPLTGFPTILTVTGSGTTLIPKFIEVHDNRLFMAGMSYALSTVWFSDIPAFQSEPEHFEDDFNFEVRTNDSEIITALKEYNGNLMVFKQTSVHQLNTSADDPANWQLTNISLEYGCLSNRAVTVHTNLCVFLDRKGLIEFNGSNITILSTRVDPFFQRMNVAAAQSQAQVIYDKQRNQILCDIPVDGATMNNLTMVYDIIAKSWTTYDNYNPAVSTIAQGQLTNRQVFYGGYSGIVSYFGSSFTTDNGVGFTCVAKSGFLTDLGNSVTKVFRRLFMDSTPVGSSSAVDIRFYQDYGSSIIISRTMYQSPFQSRIDFGIPAKSMSTEFVMGSTYSLALHGFTIEYRFERSV